LGLSAVWTEASQRGLSLHDIARWMSHSPGSVFGIGAGIAVGNPASLVVFDPDATFCVEPAQLFHRHRITPYDGSVLRGIVHATLIRGKPAATGQGKIIFRSCDRHRL
jgi:allantoinase